MILTYRNDTDCNDKTSAKKHKLQCNDDDFLPLLESSMAAKGKPLIDGPIKNGEKKVYLGELMKDKESISVISCQNAHYWRKVQRMRRFAQSKIP